MNRRLSVSIECSRYVRTCSDIWSIVVMVNDDEKGLFRSLVEDTLYTSGGEGQYLGGKLMTTGVPIGIH